MRLIHKDTGKDVQVGDKVVTFRGKNAVVVEFSKPHKPASSGHVITDLGRHYVGVYGLEWIEREDWD